MGPSLARSVLASSAFALRLLGAANAFAGDPARPRTATEATASPSDDSGVRARARYDAGTQAFSQGRFVEAALEFEAAASEKPSPIALSTAALSWERASAPERAADDYRRALAVGGLNAESTTQATQRLAALEAVLGSASVTAPRGWRAQLDAGAEMTLPATFHAASGVHTLTVRPVGGPIEQISLVLRSGTTTPVALPASEPAALSAGRESSPAPSGVDLRTSSGLVALGAAGIALLGGALLGSEALGARDAYAAAPTAASFDHANELARWTNVAWVTGGVLAAGGLVLVLWPASHATATATARVGGSCGAAAPSLCIRGGF
jgi:hypothetical protein